MLDPNYKMTPAETIRFLRLLRDVLQRVARNVPSDT
jgi:hypothetical protein